MHGNRDYELNSRVHHAVVTCALSWARIVPALRLLGLGALSDTDHYGFKEEFEPVMRDKAERSMALKHEANCKNGRTEYFTLDGGYTKPRNADGCTMAAHGSDGAIFDVVHKRLTDEGAKSSKGLEVLCYHGLLTRPRVSLYGEAAMDGCRELIQPTHAAGKRASGDLWHVGKNWTKWAELAIKVLCKRPAKDAADKADNPLVPAVNIPPERLEQLGQRPAGIKAADFVAQRVRDLGGTPEEGAAAARLKQQFGQLARERALTAPERAQEERRRAYLAEVARRKQASKEREGQRAGVADAQVWAMSWRRDLRSMLRYIAEYTRDLRGTINPATGEVWTDAERGSEFLRCWRKGGVAIVLGRTGDQTLKDLNHPITDIPGPNSLRKKAWVPPGRGFVAAGTLVFEVLDSLISDPVWDDKFVYLINGRMTYCNESFFHTLRKWGTKHSHFSRFYSLAIWCSVLSWNENIDRQILEYEWRQSKSGQLKSSAGRFYKVPVRAPQTDFWRPESWRAYKLSLQEAPPPQCASEHLAAPLNRAGSVYSAGWLSDVKAYRSCWLGWQGADPPERARIIVAQAVPPPTGKPVDEMRVEECKAELAFHGLGDTGKLQELRERITAARTDPATARAQEAPKLSRHALPAVASPREHLSSPRVERASRRTRGAATAAAPEPPPPVEPLFALYSPYKLPVEQRQKRRAPPKGQKKWTAAQLAVAAEALDCGEQPTALKRARTEEIAQAMAAASGQAGEEVGEESGEEAGEESGEEVGEEAGEEEREEECMDLLGAADLLNWG